MAWVTPKTDWTSNDYFNISDLNKIEGNIQYLSDLIESYATAPTLDTVKTDWDNTDFPYADELARIESNVEELGLAHSKPTGWINTVTDWVTGPIGSGYVMVNRIETDLLLLYNSINGTIDYLLSCGTFSASSDRVRQHFGRS